MNKKKKIIREYYFTREDIIKFLNISNEEIIIDIGERGLTDYVIITEEKLEGEND